MSRNTVENMSNAELLAEQQRLHDWLQEQTRYRQQCTLPGIKLEPDSASKHERIRKVSIQLANIYNEIGARLADTQQKTARLAVYLHRMVDNNYE
jgi:hypothetical protein